MRLHAPCTELRHPPVDVGRGCESIGPSWRSSASVSRHTSVSVGATTGADATGKIKVTPVIATGSSQGSSPARSAVRAILAQMSARSRLNRHDFACPAVRVGRRRALETVAHSLDRAGRAQERRLTRESGQGAGRVARIGDGDVRGVRSSGIGFPLDLRSELVLASSVLRGRRRGSRRSVLVWIPATLGCPGPCMRRGSRPSKPPRGRPGMWLLHFSCSEPYGLRCIMGTYLPIVSVCRDDDPGSFSHSSWRSSMRARPCRRGRGRSSGSVWHVRWRIRMDRRSLLMAPCTRRSTACPRRGTAEAEWEAAEPAEAAGRPRRRLYRVTGAGEAALRASKRAATTPSSVTRPVIA